MARKRVLVKLGATTYGEAGINAKRSSYQDVTAGYDYITPIPHYNVDMKLHLSDRRRAKVRLIASHERNSKLLNNLDYDSRGGPSQLSNCESNSVYNPSPKINVNLPS